MEATIYKFSGSSAQACPSVTLGYRRAHTTSPQLKRERCLANVGCPIHCRDSPIALPWSCFGFPYKRIMIENGCTELSMTSWIWKYNLSPVMILKWEERNNTKNPYHFMEHCSDKTDGLLTLSPGYNVR